MRVGYSYLRYSSPGQADGDSIRRQTALTIAWCKKHNVKLDTSTTYEDRGRSAFRGKHRQTGVLAQFLAEVEAGRIPKGSVLIVENLDRLSRENPWEAVPLLCSLVNGGITVVALQPETIYEPGGDLTGLILAVVEFGRGHSESKAKSTRMGAVWGEKKRQARENGIPVTSRTPGWIERQGDSLVLIPHRANIVRKIFQMAVDGLGLSLIVKTLTQEKVKTWGRGASWSKAYLFKILTGKAVLGIHQPLKHGKPDGEAIGGYYPPVIEQQVWDRAQAALKSRRDKPGPVGKRVPALFSGLLYDATTQGRMIVAMSTRGQKGKRSKRRVIVSADSMEGRGPTCSFPSEIFEKAVLSLLKEVNPADVFGEEPHESTKLAGDLAAIDNRIRTIEKELVGDAGDVPALVRAIKELEGKRAALAQQLAQARQKEANPIGEAWAETQSLLDVAEDEASRLRLRGLLRNIVQAVYVLIVPRRSHRLCAVQIFFTGDGHRDYLIHYKAAGHCRQGGFSVASMTGDDSLDLRNKADAKRLRAYLETMNLD